MILMSDYPGQKVNLTGTDCQPYRDRKSTLQGRIVSILTFQYSFRDGLSRKFSINRLKSKKKLIFQLTSFFFILPQRILQLLQ